MNLCYINTYVLLKSRILLLGKDHDIFTLIPDSNGHEITSIYIAVFGELWQFMFYFVTTGKYITNDTTVFLLCVFVYELAPTRSARGVWYNAHVKVGRSVRL